MWTAPIIVAFTETHFEFSLLSKVIPVTSHLQLQSPFSPIFVHIQILQTDLHTLP